MTAAEPAGMRAARRRERTRPDGADPAGDAGGGRAGRRRAGLALISSLYYTACRALPWLPVVTLAGARRGRGATPAPTPGPGSSASPARGRSTRCWWPGSWCWPRRPSLAGAIFAGFYAGLTGWLLSSRPGPPSGPAGRRRRAARLAGAGRRRALAGAGLPGAGAARRRGPRAASSPGARRRRPRAEPGGLRRTG